MTIHHATDRDTTIDTMRGIAVVLMIIAHAIFFFHNETHAVLNIIERFANILTLSLFVFVSGMSASKTVQKYDHVSLSHRLLSVGKYVGIIYFVYATATILNFALTKELLTDAARSQKIIQALLFITPANFMEYMSLFFFFPILSLIKPFIKMCQKSTLFPLVTVALCSWLLAMYIYRLPAYGFLQYLKELLAGGDNMLRFPLLFYLPIYIVGVWWEGHKSPLALAWFSVGTFLIHAAALTTGSPFLSLDVRWPPSLGFLSVGITASMCIYYFITYGASISLIKKIYGFYAYVGKDALDFWLSHIALLLIYQYSISYKSDQLLVVSGMSIALLLTSILISSIGITNAISLTHLGPVAIIHPTTRRFRKRYIALLLVSASIIITSILTATSTTLYGSTMPSATFAQIEKPQTVSIRAAEFISERTWHVRSGPSISPIELTINAVDNTNTPIAVTPAMVQIVSGTTVVPSAQIVPTTTGAHVYIAPSVFPAGIIELHATIQSSQSFIKTNSVSLNISEPLFVAWTFDWEGWEAADSAIQTLIDIQKTFNPIPFTHFVNPRTFISDAVPENKKKEITDYLLSQQLSGNEIALHLHMHYDMVQSSGVTIRTGPHWGLRSNEGYDVPTTEYSPDEFRLIAGNAKRILADLGFTNVTGYRAGGWFISNDQLKILQSLGFTYDSSGRDKPTSGAFKNIPWNLPLGSQPYILFNDPGQEFMEIPNNSGATYEQSISELYKRITDVYTAGILDKPKMLVFVSHPQFAPREFGKIPEVLNKLMRQSYKQDAGPIIFSTIRSIQTQW